MKFSPLITTARWVAAFGLTAVSIAAAQKDESFEKYGQEFKGKIAER